MIELWYQWTCDGCGATDTSTESNLKKTQVIKELKESRWQQYKRLNYCPRCVASGNARNRVVDMNH